VPLDVMLLVLAGRALHAGRNALVKAGADKRLDTVAVTIGPALPGAPALPFLPVPARASWPCLAASAAIRVGHSALVAAACRAGETSIACALMRGAAAPLVMLTPLRRPGGIAVALIRRWRVAAIGGFCAATSYTLALWAMTRGDDAGADRRGGRAARDLDLFGVALATIAPKERPGWRRQAAAIACGAAALRLARAVSR
jgi:hypothetical protein